MAVGDIYRVLDFQTYGGQQVLNVYYYRMTVDGLGPYAESVYLAYVQDVLPSIIAIQNQNAVHTRLEVLNITDGLENFQNDLTSGNVGTRTGETTPSYMAYGFKLLRGSLLTRNGAKRIVGPSESDIQGNTPLTAMLTVLNTCANAFAATISIALGPEFRPVIVKRPILPPGGNQVFSFVIGGQFTYLTTQNTRKFFRPGV